MSEQTPAQIQSEIEALEEKIGELQLQEIEAKVAEQAQPAAPVVSPTQSSVRRIMPTGQFQTPPQGSDE